MKVALIHDYLREYGGAERVVEVLHEMYPEAPLYTSFVDWQALGSHADRFKNWEIRTSWVDRNWLVKKYHSPLRFLTPLVWESLDLRGFDVVISSSGWFMCRGVITQPETVHISYMHHPPRNLYGFPTGRRQTLPVKLYASLINPFLRMYDFTTARRVDYLVANSEETKRRIEKYYRREAAVIYPPVEIPVVSSKQLVVRKNNYFLSVGRLSYAKRIDVIIEAYNELQLPLKIVGVGREEDYLRSIAGSTIEFLGDVSDSELARLYQGARALIFCALQEDFGMVPVEAMGYGVPVIALNQGGVQETVVDGKTGVLFADPSKGSIASAIKRFETIEQKLTKSACQKQAAKFSKTVFVKKMKTFVEEKIEEHHKQIMS
ncbi:glycosyltransferase family 4 protein [Candidatus Microgenomates bacterium]|nr:MAG: glycosyltransferase family 4 protein [Candidatus Microgenomates bacterium]